jgi:hypothetical protein
MTPRFDIGDIVKQNNSKDSFEIIDYKISTEFLDSYWVLKSMLTNQKVTTQTLDNFIIVFPLKKFETFYEDNV